MLNRVVRLKFTDHDITDEKKILEMAREKYLCAKSVPGTTKIVLETQVWATKLDKLGIFNQMEIPHFEHILEINVCVKVFLICIHGVTLWIDPSV
jgi:hypothetical protein